VSHDVSRLDALVIEQGGDISRHAFDRERPSERLTETNAAVVQGHAAKLIGQPIDLRMPALSVNPDALDQQDGRTFALDAIGE
jgi:hypothetical protein